MAVSLVITKFLNENWGEFAKLLRKMQIFCNLHKFLKTDAVSAAKQGGLKT